MKAGSRIRERRLAAGMTQQQLAEKVGVSKATISQWESGEIRMIKGENLIMLSRVLNSPVDYLQAVTRGKRHNDAPPEGDSQWSRATQPKPPDTPKSSQMSVARLAKALEEVETAAAMLGMSLSYFDKAARVVERYNLAVVTESVRDKESESGVGSSAR